MTLFGSLNPFSVGRPAPDQALAKDMFAKLKYNPVDTGIQKLIQEQSLLENQAVSPGIYRPQIMKVAVNPPVPPVGPPPVNPNILPVVTPSNFIFQLPGMIASIAKNSKLILPLIPPLLHKLYSSEQKIPQHINVEITASGKQKIYEIGFGKTNELSVYLEVVAGKEIRSLYNIEAAKRIKTVTPSIFSSFSLLSYIPLLNRFEYKRQKIETNCNIIVNDPGNYLLKNGPILKYYRILNKRNQFSKEISFNIIHMDPLVRTVSSLTPSHSPSYLDDTRIKSAYVKITEPITAAKEHRTQIFPLPFDADPMKANDCHLRVTQYQ